MMQGIFKVLRPLRHYAMGFSGCIDTSFNGEIISIMFYHQLLQ